MEGVGSATDGFSKREDLEVKDSLAACNLKAPVMDLNLQFYQGKIVSEPHGVTVDEILSWYDDLPKLETYHGYIQWLFPTSQPSSSNRYAQPLQPEEAEAIQQDKKARIRFLRAYLMMLNFYGMVIADYGTGTLNYNEHYKDRFVNLNSSTHNHIRITRIIKSLGEMGLERYQFPLVKFLLVEAISTGRLLDAIPSARDFWVKAVKDASERNILQDFAIKLAKQAMDSNPPHVTKGNMVCTCRHCTALRELQKMALDYQPEAQAGSDHQPKAHARTDQQLNVKVVRACDNANCKKCRNKVFISTDRDHQAAERVVQIEDLSHLTLELDKISARLNVVAAERAQQKTIETPEQIEELGCLMDELKQVSIALGTVSTKLEALSLGERFIQKEERQMAAKRLTGKNTESCTTEEPSSALVATIHEATPGNKRPKAGALQEECEKKVVRFHLDSPPKITLDPEEEVDHANSSLAKHSFSSTAEENAALEGLSTCKDGSCSEGDLSDSVQVSLKKKEVSFTGARLEGFAESSEKLWTSAGVDGKDDFSLEKQRPLEGLQGSSWSEQNPRMPGIGNKMDRKGSGRGEKKKVQDDLTKEIELDEDWDLNNDNYARSADDTQESEEAFAEPTWMKAFRERSAQDKAAHT